MNDEKKNKDDIAQLLQFCSKMLSLNEFSRETGIRIELLRRFINKQARQARAETWDKIYPSIREFLGEPLPEQKMKRIGPPYRRHNELVEMLSDQKVLLDVFNVLSSAKQQQTIKTWQEKSPAAPTEYSSLSDDENKLMGAFMAMTPEMRDAELLALVAEGRRAIAGKR